MQQIDDHLAATHDWTFADHCNITKNYCLDRTGDPNRSLPCTDPSRLIDHLHLPRLVDLGSNATPHSLLYNIILARSILQTLETGVSIFLSLLLHPTYLSQSAHDIFALPAHSKSLVTSGGG